MKTLYEPEINEFLSLMLKGENLAKLINIDYFKQFNIHYSSDKKCDNLFLNNVWHVTQTCLSSIININN